MADAKTLKDLGIPLRIDGATRFVKGATKYTTCGDVIKMVLKKTGIQKEYRRLFSIYEVTQNGERVLTCKTRILGEMKKWNDNNNRFVLRKTDPIGQRQKLPVKDPVCKKKVVRLVSTDKHIKVESSSSESSDTSFEEFLSKVDRTKLLTFMKFFKVMTTSEENKATTNQRESSPKVASVKSKQQSGTKMRQQKVAPIRQGRKSKQPRQTRSSNNLIDRHPNKIYRVDYGYVDRIPGGRQQTNINNDIFRRVPNVNQDSVNDFLNLHVSEERETIRQDVESNSRKGARRMLPFTRYILSGKRKVDNFGSTENSKPFLKEKIRETYFEGKISDCQRNGGYEIVEDCREIWDVRSRNEVDSGHDDSSDGSSIQCPASSSSIDSSSSDMSICADTANDRKQYFARQPTKLVDYSISTDEEYDEDEDVLNECFDKRGINSCSLDHSDTGISPDNAPRLADMKSYIKHVFSKKCAVNEDDEMDSFMKSKIYDDSSDEGVSSLECGLDNVHL